jgi:hypothetical protein
MKNLIPFLAVALSLAIAAPALAIGDSGRSDRFASTIAAPRDDGDDTDPNPPPEGDGGGDPLEDPPPESP